MIVFARFYGSVREAIRSPAVPLERAISVFILGFAFQSLVASSAWAADKVALTLASNVEGRTGPIMLAIDRGYFTAEGIDFSFSPGTGGSADTVNRVARGTFQFGIGDAASLIKFNVVNPRSKVKAVFNFYMADLAIVTMKSSGIKAPADLKGRILGAPTGDTAYRMFPAFTAATGVAKEDVRWEHMAMSVREVMLLQGKVDAITGTAISAYFGLKSAGAAESDIVFLRYKDYGINIIGNALMTTEVLTKERPELVSRVVRAISRGWMDSVKDPYASVDAALKREPLLKRDIELAKLKDAIRNFVSHADAQTLGVGSYSDDTLKFSVDVISRSEGISAPVLPSDIADMSFLPPVAERTAPKL